MAFGEHDRQQHGEFQNDQYEVHGNVLDRGSFPYKLGGPLPANGHILSENSHSFSNDSIQPLSRPASPVQCRTLPVLSIRKKAGLE